MSYRTSSRRSHQRQPLVRRWLEVSKVIYGDLAAPSRVANGVHLLESDSSRASARRLEAAQLELLLSQYLKKWGPLKWQGMLAEARPLPNPELTIGVHN